MDCWCGTLAGHRRRFAWYARSGGCVAGMWEKMRGHPIYAKSVDNNERATGQGHQRCLAEKRDWPSKRRPGDGKSEKPTLPEDAPEIGERPALRGGEIEKGMEGAQGCQRLRSADFRGCR